MKTIINIIQTIVIIALWFFVYSISKEIKSMNDSYSKSTPELISIINKQHSDTRMTFINEANRLLNPDYLQEALKLKADRLKYKDMIDCIIEDIQARDSIWNTEK